MTAIQTTNRVQLVPVAAVLWIVAAFGYLVAEKVAADNIKGPYSYIHQYISVLGVSEWGRFAYLMNGAFYLQGALLFIGAVLVVRDAGRRGVLFVFFRRSLPSASSSSRPCTVARRWRRATACCGTKPGRCWPSLEATRR